MCSTFYYNSQEVLNLRKPEYHVLGFNQDLDSTMGLSTMQTGQVHMKNWANSTIEQFAVGFTW